MGEGILRGWPCPDWTLENQLDGAGVHQLFFLQGNIFIDSVVNGKANYKPSPKSPPFWVVYVNHSQMVGKNLMMDTEELWLMRLNIRNCRNPSVDMNRFDKTRIVSLSSMHNSPHTPYQAHLVSPVCISLLGMFSPHVISAKVKTWGQNQWLPRSSSNLLYKALFQVIATTFCSGCSGYVGLCWGQCSNQQQLGYTASCQWGSCQCKAGFCANNGALAGNIWSWWAKVVCGWLGG